MSKTVVPKNKSTDNKKNNNAARYSTRHLRYCDAAETPVTIALFTAVAGKKNVPEMTYSELTERDGELKPYFLTE